jgi:hypothetical protein
VPATVALVCIVAFAETRVRLLRTAILARRAGRRGGGCLLRGLGIPVPAFRWGR